MTYIAQASYIEVVLRCVLERDVLCNLVVLLTSLWLSPELVTPLAT